MTTARCMRCKKQVEIKGAKEVIAKNGARMLKGKCPECGTGVSRFLPKA